ncbi:MAG: hypothetical protein DRI90_10265 [Deltaproteobacteria bacterium]|nr:MAG: hypothetical protein DRI90_10265 [Deltaproteobacteria bacterium]
MWVLRDDFEDGQLDATLWEIEHSTGSNIAETNGDLVFELGTNDSFLTHVLSALAYDFTNRTVTIEIPTAVVEPPNSDVDVSFAILGDEGNYVEFYVDDGMLVCAVEINSQWQAIMSEPYNPTEHRWLRFEDNGSQVVWLVSGDVGSPTNWTVRSQYDLDQVFDRRWTHVGVAVYGTTTNQGGTYRFDNLNVDVGTESHCPMDSWSDDFDDGDVSDGWLHADGSGGCTIQENNGEVHIDCATGVDDYYQIYSQAGFDLTGSNVTIQNTRAPESGSEMGMMLSVWAPNLQDGLLFDMDAGTNYLSVVDAGNKNDVAQMSYQAADQRWVRIREDSGTVSFEGSSDGVAWTLLTSTVPTFAVTTMKIELTAYTSTTLTAPAGVSWDDLNLPPAP